MMEPEYTLEKLKNFATTDYQQFDIENKELIPKYKHKTKFDLLSKFMIKMKDMSVIEIGADKGLYSYMALKNGASSVLSNDTNISIFPYREAMLSYLGFSNFGVTYNNLFVPEKSYMERGYVIALAVLHQIEEGTMESRIHRIWDMSRVGSLIEFCEDYQEVLGDDWSLDHFKSILSTYYSSFELIGKYEAVGDYKGIRYIYDCRCH